MPPPNLRERLEAMLALFFKVQRELRALEARARAGQMPSPAVLWANETALPAIAAQMAVFQSLARVGDGTPDDSAALIQSLHTDLAMLDAVIEGRVTLGEIQNN